MGTDMAAVLESPGGPQRRQASARRILAEVNASGAASLAAARRLVGAASELRDLRPDGYLGAHPLLAPLLPWPAGLRRGCTISVERGTSVLLGLLAEAMGESGYAAIVGLPALGMVAAAEQGVPLQRLALVPDPGVDWPTVVAALIDGVDMVVLAPPAQVADGTARALASRARRTGAVLITTRPWVGCDVRLRVAGPRWHGLAEGRGRLRHAEAVVTSVGRGAASQQREVRIPIPLPAPVRSARVTRLDRPA
ncbi:hypothetical protein [Micromonospora sp. NPDC049662]|uniref:hypothetical protein n=1 Tax=Micromonospora sp. NPDC049662 TaxID=3155397 RepID=UPI0034404D0E